METRSLRLLAAATAAVGLVSCRGGAGAPHRAAPRTAAPLARLQWLAGTWRGSGPGGGSFYEGYTFRGDTLLTIHYFADSTLAQVRDSGNVFWARDSIFHQAGDALWVAASVGPDSAAFLPLRNAGNAFTWRRQGPQAWRAVLRRPNGGELVYELTRYPRR
jgi:hypothetical protein